MLSTRISSCTENVRRRWRPPVISVTHIKMIPLILFLFLLVTRELAFCNIYNPTVRRRLELVPIEVYLSTVCGMFLPLELIELDQLIFRCLYAYVWTEMAHPRLGPICWLYLNATHWLNRIPPAHNIADMGQYSIGYLQQRKKKKKKRKRKRRRKKKAKQSKVFWYAWYGLINKDRSVDCCLVMSSGVMESSNERRSTRFRQRTTDCVLYILYRSIVWTPQSFFVRILAPIVCEP